MIPGAHRPGPHGTSAKKKGTPDPENPRIPTSAAILTDRAQNLTQTLGIEKIMADFNFFRPGCSHQDRHFFAKTKLQRRVGIDVDFGKIETEGAQAVGHVIAKMTIATAIKGQ